jgi:hypothetical protein
MKRNIRISRKKKDCFSLLPCTFHYGTLFSLLFLSKHRQPQLKGSFEWKHKQSSSAHNDSGEVRILYIPECQEKKKKKKQFMAIFHKIE